MKDTVYPEPFDDYPLDLGFHEDIVLNFPLHYHPALEAIFVHTGRARLLTDGGVLEMTAGDVVLIPSLMVHGYSSEEESTTCTAIFHNEVFLDEENYIPVNACRRPIPLSFPDADTRELILYSLRELLFYQGAKDIPMSLNYSKILLLQLLRLAKTSLEPAPERMRGSQIAHAERILLYVQQHYREKITLDTLSQYLGIDKFTISKIINQSIGMRIYDLVNKYRLLDACYLLEHTEKSMPEVAELSSFTSVSAMFRNFRKTFGMSPLEYRKGKGGFTEHGKKGASEEV